MWSMEYDPNIFQSYEEPTAAAHKNVIPKRNDKLLKQYGKFVRRNVKSGCKDQIAF